MNQRVSNEEDNKCLVQKLHGINHLAKTCNNDTILLIEDLAVFELYNSV